MSMGPAAYIFSEGALYLMVWQDMVIAPESMSGFELDVDVGVDGCGTGMIVLVVEVQFWKDPVVLAL
jgi:hypothetical protein